MGRNTHMDSMPRETGNSTLSGAISHTISSIVVSFTDICSPWFCQGNTLGCFWESQAQVLFLFTEFYEKALALSENFYIINPMGKIYPLFIILLKAFCFYFQSGLVPIGRSPNLSKKVCNIINETQERREFCLWQETINKVNYAIKRKLFDSLCTRWKLYKDIVFWRKFCYNQHI